MSDISKITANFILKIPDTEPERLFSNSLLDAKREYRDLCKFWHTDYNKSSQAADVIRKINILWDLAEQKLKNGNWVIPGLLQLTDTNGKSYNIRYVKKHDIELGEMYIGRTIVAFTINMEFEDLYENAKRRVTKFDYKTDRMKDEISKYLPEVLSAFKTDTKCVLVLKKKEGMVLLKDLHEYYAGQMDAKHVAWMLSSLHNLVCYFNYANITHNGISLDTFFVSPELHSGALLGGWWYSVGKDDKLLAVSAKLREYMPPDIIGKKKGDIRFDLELIRTLGRELLGDITGMTLIRSGIVPQQMLDWLRMPTTGKAVKDYDLWYNKVLKESFGERRFVKMATTFSDIYGDGG